MPEITLTLDDLKYLLDQQKESTIEYLFHGSAYYNKDSTEGSLRTLSIDKEKFMKYGRESKYPNDYNVLKKYLKS